MEIIHKEYLVLYLSYPLQSDSFDRQIEIGEQN